MGGSLSKEEIDRVQALAKFQVTPDEIKRMHATWKEIGSGESLTMDQWKTFSSKSNPDLADYDVESAFRILDTDSSGTISFEEWVLGSVIREDPTVEQFVDACIAIYDEDGDGEITVEEMRKIGLAKKRAEGSKLGDAEKEAVAKWVDLMFSAIDSNKDGSLSRDEIVTAVNKDPTLKDAF